MRSFAQQKQANSVPYFVEVARSRATSLSVKCMQQTSPINSPPTNLINSTSRRLRSHMNVCNVQALLLTRGTQRLTETMEAVRRNAADVSVRSTDYSVIIIIAMPKMKCSSQHHHCLVGCRKTHATRIISDTASMVTV